MSADQRLLAVGFYITSALYLSAVAVFGWLTGHPLSWKLAVASMGFACLSYLAQITRAPATVTDTWFLMMVAMMFWLLSMLGGAFAGVMLLF